MTRAQLDATTDELRALIAERLNIRARSFGAAVRKAGRRLPAPARAAAAELEALAPRLDHPKLAARTDPARVTRAADILRRALTRHRAGDLAARDRAILLAEVGFRVLVVLAAGMAFFWWYGSV